MILVGGAAGKTGRAVVRALAERGAAVRAWVHHPAQAEEPREAGAREVVAGDMRDPARWASAVRGTCAVYHICPNLAPDEPAIGQMAIAATRDGGVDRFVYHSVLHPQTEEMPHHWKKLRVEEQILESGLPFTILQPASYMQNVLAAWDVITTEGIYRVPYGVDTRLGMVDLRDVAESAAIVLTEPGHEGATYELAGPEALTQLEVAAGLAQHLARPVQAETIPLEVWERYARAAGLGDYQVETLLAMFRYYDRNGFWGSPRVLSWILGRSPTSFAAFLSTRPPCWA
ncbi:MAG: NmrA family NAD(P)-binding protein [Chloroflexota bacterium]|nr:NmrA family NAD(P)-binding protein [Chloroflexota bacterium]